MLTKSQFRDAEPCVKRTWLSVHRKDLREPLSATVQLRINKGNKFTEIVRSRFPDGILVEEIGHDALPTTASLLEDATGRPLFEAAFLAENFFAQVDVLVPLESGGWHLIEAKLAKNIRSGKSLKEKYIRDVGFQLVVLRKAGVDVRKVSLASVNPELENPFQPEDVVVFTDITAELESYLPKLAEEAKLTLQILDDPMPAREPNTYCGDCPYTNFCHEGVDMETYLPTLPRITHPQVTTLRLAGVETIPQIPAEWIAKRHPTAQNAWQCLTLGSDIVKPELWSILRSKPFPWLFLDFEAVMFEFPRYVGTQAYEVLPFQWSAHLLQDLQSEPEWSDFLHTHDSDPRLEFATSLTRVVAKAATVFTYSSYERTRVKDLGDESLMRDLALKECDLLPLIQSNVYLPQFEGSFSIKYVLPALTDLNYSDLDIQDGQAAAAEYERMLDIMPGDPELARQIEANLRSYCQRDTLAMVKVVEALLQREQPLAG